ncbi:MAG: murein hydrolase activator EnvC family protein [Bacillota bacterium]
MQGRSLVFVSILLALSIFVVGPFASGVHAQTTAEIQQQIAEHNKKIADLDAEIAQYQKQLDALGSQHATLATSIKSLDTQRKALTTKIQSLQQQIGKLNLEIRQLGGQIADKEQSISLNKRTIAQSLRDIDQTDTRSMIEQVFSSRDLGELWVAVDTSMTLNEALRDHTTELAQVKQQLADQQQQVSQTQQKLVSVTTDLGTQKKAVDVTVSQKNALLTQTKNQEASYQKLIAQKRAEQASFEAALYQLSLKLKAADNTKIPAKGKGVLAWPLDHITITQYFGKTTDSGRLYANGTHNGVDFAAAIGTPVHAALAGTVVEINQGAVQNCQYGKWVLVKHANGLSTLYAHLSQISVAKGQTVSTGQVLGYSGMTGYATGPHLHLTVYNSSSVSFTNYQCKSGYTVYIPIAPPNGYLDPLAYL